MSALLIVAAYAAIGARLFVTFGRARAQAYMEDFPSLASSCGVDKGYVVFEAVVMALFWPVTLAVRSVGPALWRAIERDEGGPS